MKGSPVRVRASALGSLAGLSSAWQRSTAAPGYETGTSSDRFMIDEGVTRCPGLWPFAGSSPRAGRLSRREGGEADSLYREGWIATAPRQGRAGTRGHSRAPQSTRESASTRRTPCKWQQPRAASDPFINHEAVRSCTRFAPGSRPPPSPRQKKVLQARLKPTPGLEPGTPSLRGKDE